MIFQNFTGMHINQTYIDKMKFLNLFVSFLGIFNSHIFEILFGVSFFNFYFCLEFCDIFAHRHKTHVQKINIFKNKNGPTKKQITNLKMLSLQKKLAYSLSSFFFILFLLDLQALFAWLTRGTRYISIGRECRNSRKVFWTPLLFEKKGGGDERGDFFFFFEKANENMLFPLFALCATRTEFGVFIESGALNNRLDFDGLMERAEHVDLRHSRIRSVYWKIYLGYLPIEINTWASCLNEKRSEYTRLCEKYIGSMPIANYDDNDGSSDVLIDNPLLHKAG
ncbi:hypothetical protein RFI_07037, partial [Reticulomyxa filosa]